MKINMKRKINSRSLSCWGLLSLLLVVSMPALADSSESGNIAGLLAQNLSYVATMFNAFSVLCGVAMICGSILAFKKVSMGRTMMTQQASMVPPSLMLLAGVFFMMLPTVISTSLLSFWGTASPLTSPVQGSQEPWAAYEPVVLDFIRLIGVGSFMRSFFLMARCGGHAQPGTAGKALTHFFAGILLVHIQGTMYLIDTFFGVGW